MTFNAHKRTLEDGSEEFQTVTEHSKGTANYARACLECIDLGSVGYVAGLLHDMGKFKVEFSEYLESGDMSKRGSVNHTFAGCRYILEHFHHDMLRNEEDMTAELLAFAIGGHHGLFDCVDFDGRSGFEHRLLKEHIGYQESCRNFLGECCDEQTVATYFARANEEMTEVYRKLAAMSLENGDKTQEEYKFYFGLMARLLLSVVIDSDRQDTLDFMSGRSFTQKRDDMSELWQEKLAFMEQKLKDFPRNTALEKTRMEISDQCRKMAENGAGIYRLNVPTGGGKTLSALRFALAHAAKWNKRRIIFVTPLLSILDQNAEVIRQYVGDNEIILEHHSNIIRTDETRDELDTKELAVENWQKPIIITTMVQLLNTLFLGKTTNIRRFQALTGAVIVLDEVQTVPNHMLSLFNLAVNFLTEICGATFVLCSATQPCFEAAVHPMLDHITEIVPYQEKLWRAFERTRIQDVGIRRLDEIPQFVQKVAEQERSVLIICNKKSEAEFLYDMLKDGEKTVFHLSAGMCMDHRRKVLEEIKTSLDDFDKRMICVSTQVIEAGIDISFDAVIRLLAGMDSVVQAAGRCNRNGKKEGLASVYVVHCVDEQLDRLREIKRGKNASADLLAVYHNEPTQFQNNLLSSAAIDWYYHKLYDNMRMIEDFQNYYIKEEDITLFSLLSANAKSYNGTVDYYGKYLLSQAFKTAGMYFHVFDEDTVDVIVPYGEGKKLIKELEDAWTFSLKDLIDWQERAKPFTISLYHYQWRALEHQIREVKGVLILPEPAYDTHTGLKVESEMEFLEV